jgi:mannose-6-phosphate isomerase-like protein (cupin superfamily)
MKSEMLVLALITDVREARAMETIELGRGARATIIVRAEDTDGQCSVVVGELDTGLSGPPLHRHPGFTETYVGVAGRLKLRCGSDQIALGPGDVAVVPAGTPHTFRSSGNEPARWVNVFAPGGIEGYFREAAELLPADAPPDPVAMAEVAARYGLELVDDPDD